MSAPRPDRDTLMAYVDGQLTPARRADVERYLAYEAKLAAADPQQARAAASASAEITALQAQRQGLRDALDPLLDEPIPARLLQRPVPPTRHWARAASIVMWLGVGAVAGSLATRSFMPQQALVAQAQDESTMHFVRQAELAYAVYSPDPRRPVEVRNGSDLTTWLSRRLNRPIVAPEALPGGLELMGGRLLPGMPDKPAAQLMYQNAQGKRITVFLRAMAKPTTETGFRIVDHDGTSTFYWVDRDWGYALTGELPRAQMLQAAKLLYQRYAPQQPDPPPASVLPAAPAVRQLS
jgi:anti-sigma factor RsiW